MHQMPGTSRPLLGRSGRRGGVSTFLTTGAVALVATALVGGLAYVRRGMTSAGTPLPSPAALTFHTILGGVAHAQTNAGLAGDPTAVALYRKTLHAQAATPVQARIRVTRWPTPGRSPEPAQIIEVIEGEDSSYRFTYVAPDAIRGRVIVCDGTNVYQYEPSKRVVTRRPVPAHTNPLDANADALAARRVRLGTAAGPVAGRPVQVLEVWSTEDGSLRERRWIDKASGRSLRIDAFTRGGALVRRFEMLTVSFGAPTDRTAFAPRFPNDVRLITAASDRPTDAKEVAHRLGLPSSVGTYSVRTAVVPKQRTPASLPGVGGGHHLLYSDGVHAISLFVSTSTPGSSGDALRQGPGWTPYQVAPGVNGFTREDAGQGRAAVAWARAGRRYVAVSRLPLGQLLDVADDLAAGSTVGAAKPASASPK